MENKFKVLGMHCQACQKVIEKKLMKIEGVSQVIALLSGEVTVVANRSITSDEVKLALEGTEYQIS
ncbi:hypothetical protein A2778_05660 [Candidatus Daviesbacteria bacterium RIFCSPHIGHO2_01_FULL_40_24]|uniref:HMA domain-containing protein n=1 Tax=Candidatus Daviesbacteria bacterium GW2011_GWC2_40_12 TaxID=1618431 RepID=A0A0G0QQR7_9BACT|nr:MAG: hypothetical protein UT45_C0001G0077 [Candidatus Daviesbacteria bacterium GW2011_GWA2_39_33]KKR42779.1 MAG: hypothetical protein UT77_C0001G0230 [Candidatus Daviesbacteria bacterium GW2011_GWC2_40_12]OGE21640.1 MAG: hypothetical protein A2778_05660 [Candidatus Daviesbacteria bacterium RIFCSPHIGHO2_01_FULL_40_24]OGE30037.1 MAG: hypothetical protein A3C29_01365 [Candidatus Daviesbacteria bacterium RIFCSPHIGHO2_02_FULL_40_16]OGE43528.1 MAG: hypothetical protein A3A53_02750 [Candidatus Davi